jgi:hypothetical protein
MKALSLMRETNKLYGWESKKPPPVRVMV